MSLVTSVSHVLVTSGHYLSQMSTSCQSTIFSVFAPLNEIVEDLDSTKRARWEQMWTMFDRQSDVMHPLIYQHPVSGMPVRYSNAMHYRVVVGVRRASNIFSSDKCIHAGLLDYRRPFVAEVTRSNVSVFMCSEHVAIMFRRCAFTWARRWHMSSSTTTTADEPPSRRKRDLL